MQYVPSAWNFESIEKSKDTGAALNLSTLTADMADLNGIYPGSPYVMNPPYLAIVPMVLSLNSFGFDIGGIIRQP